MMDQRIKRSRAQESRGAALHDGRRNAGSGNHWQRKNDVRTNDGQDLFEYKRTDKQSITIKAADLADLRRNALLDGRNPRFGIELDGYDYVLVPAEDYEVLKERANAATTGLVEGEVLPDRPRPDDTSGRSGRGRTATRGQARVQRPDAAVGLPDP